jgi:hypothetical protein
MCLSPLKLWVRIPVMARCTQWFSPSTPVSSTNKTYRHDITEILLKVALNKPVYRPFSRIFKSGNIKQVTITMKTSVHSFGITYTRITKIVNFYYKLLNNGCSYISSYREKIDNIYIQIRILRTHLYMVLTIITWHLNWLYTTKPV